MRCSAVVILALLVGCGRVGYGYLESEGGSGDAQLDAATDANASEDGAVDAGSTDASDAAIADDAGTDGGSSCANPFVASAIAAGDFHACAISASKVYCWGLALSGQLGNGNTDLRTTPTQIADTGDFTAITAMTNGTCALRADGMLRCFGDNFSGGMANGGSQSVTSPIDTISGAAVIAGGDGFMLTRDAAGLATVWGANFDGNLGLGAATVGTAVRTETTIAASMFGRLATGYHHACVTNTSGNALCAGDNVTSQLGIAGGDRDVFTLVTNALAFVVLDGGYETTCGVTTGGELYCWGRNDPVYIAGQGNPAASPTRMGTLAGFTDVSVGFDTLCALRDGGRLYCVGDGDLGGLGLSDELDRDTLTEVTPGTTYSSVSVGRDYACAIRATDSVLVCFGRNDGGQLARGASTTRGVEDVCLP